MRTLLLFCLCMVLTIGSTLFFVANEVNSREKQLAELRRDIHRTTESIQILRAEWSYLNAPTRLEALAGEHLVLKPIRIDQYRSIAELPYATGRPSADPAEPAADEPRLLVNAGPRPGGSAGTVGGRADGALLATPVATETRP